MDESRVEILKMVQAGQITVDEAERLLAALGDRQGDQAEALASGRTAGRWFKIRVYEGGQETPKVSVTIPAAVARLALRLGLKFGKFDAELKGMPVDIDFDEVKKDIEQVLEEMPPGRVDFINVVDGNTRVQIYLE